MATYHAFHYGKKNQSFKLEDERNQSLYEANIVNCLNTLSFGGNKMLKNADLKPLNEEDVLSVTGGSDITSGKVQCIVYKVKKHENLADIALRYGITTEKLCELNKIPMNKVLSENDSLLIPKV